MRSCGDGQLVRNLGLVVDPEQVRPGELALSTHEELLFTVAFTTICWVVMAFIPRLATDRKALVDFYRKVRPFGPGWRPIREDVPLSPQELAADGRMNIPLALAGWVCGCTTVWSALFCLGNYLYGRMDYATILGVIFVASGASLIFVINRLWTK